MHRVAWLVVVGVAATVRCSGIGPDEIACEGAVQRLVDCCPGFPAGTVRCVERRTTCEAEPPELSGEEARCIAGASCDALVAHGTCALVPSPSWREGLPGSRASPCP